MTGTSSRRQISIAVLGSDDRQKQLAEELKLRFNPSSVLYGETPAELTKQVDVIILPIPGLSLSIEETQAWLDTLNPQTRLLVGKTSPFFASHCKTRGIEMISYIDRTDFKIANAVPTAEGAMKLYMELSQQTIADMRMLVLGFGHCGKALAIRLKAMGADVTVFARKHEDRIYGKTLGLDMREYKELPKLVRQRTCVFNTIPFRVLDESILTYMPKDSLIIDLASAPGGTDFALCEQLKLTADHALSLPGRYFPKTAGRILADTIVSMIREIKIV